MNKTIEEVAQEQALKLGYFNFKDANEISSTYHMWIYVEKCMQEYAKQCCDEQIKACGNVLDDLDLGHFQNYKKAVSRILSTPNVAEKP